jgi:hypothetical protein
MESSNGFLPSLAIEWRAGWRLPAALACCTLLTLAAAQFSRLDGLPGGLLRLFILGCGILACRQQWPRRQGGIHGIQVTGGGRFLVAQTGSPVPWRAARVEASWTIPGIATALAFVDGDGRRLGGVVLFRDHLQRDTWRRLQVRLRHARVEPRRVSRQRVKPGRFT